MSDEAERGLYLLADTPLTSHPVALEDGGGDTKLLAESITDLLTDEEVAELMFHLISHRAKVGEEGTAIKCNGCGRIRETSEGFPTIVACEECGSYDREYVDQ